MHYNNIKHRQILNLPQSSVIFNEAAGQVEYKLLYAGNFRILYNILIEHPSKSPYRSISLMVIFLIIKPNPIYEDIIYPILQVNVW